MSGRDGEESLPATRNAMSGLVSGQVVQAQSIGAVHFHEPEEAPEPVIPLQLPPVPQSFASRRRELRALSRPRDGSGSRPILVVLSGTAGVGKTTLALRWLHDVRDEYPDGQLFIDLGGDSAAPVVPSQALEWFLLALGVAPRRVPVEPAQRGAMYRTATAGRRMVVLLDNAVSAAQVRPLIPAGDTGVAVVTSRWRLSELAMDGARWVGVDPLDVPDSVNLLERVLGAERVSADETAAEELAALCGGLPLALSIVAARLSTRPQRTLTREVADLRAERRRFTRLALDENTSVEAVLDMSYNALPDDARWLYRVCAGHPGREFGVSVAAAAANRVVDDIESTMDILVEANFLLEVDDRRFSYHDLLRLHARRRSELEDAAVVRVGALRGMVGWYLDRTVRVDLTRPSRRPPLGPRYQSVRVDDAEPLDERDGLRWFELERTNLYAAAAAAAEQGWHDLVWQLCEAMWGFFLHTRHYGDWIDLQIMGIDSARRCADRRAEARLRSQLGYAYAKIGRYEDAKRQDVLAMELAQAEHFTHGAATALSQLGRLAREIGDLPAALDNFARVRDTHRSAGNPYGAALASRRIGRVLAELGRYDEALTELRGAASTMLELGNHTQYARALMMIGRTMLDAGRIELAQPPLREGLALMRDLGSPTYQADLLAQLGEAQVLAGQDHDARHSFQEALALYLRTGDPHADVMRARLAALA